MSHATASPSISVVVPAFNEEGSLRETVAAIRRALANQPGDAELVLVDDGSTDGTRPLMYELARDSSITTQVVEIDTNSGMGNALAHGCAAATGEVITWIPGDGEYELTEVLLGLALLDRHRIVLVRRTSRGQFGRNVLSAAMYVLIRVLFRFDARRYCGIFVVRRDDYRSLDVTSRDVFFTLEVALRARMRQWVIADIDAEWRPRRAGRSKVFNLRTVIRNVAELFQFRWRLWRQD